MKHTCYAILFFILCSLGANAQVAFEAGLNMGNMAIKSGGDKQSTKFKRGAMFGLAVDMPISDHVYLQPGLFYEMGGCEITSDPKGEYNINSIGIPINVEYKSGEKCGSRFFAGVGPHIGYNINGTYSIAEYGPFQGTSGEIKFGGGTGALKQIDLGIGANFGYIFNKHWYFRFRYQTGLTSLYQSGNKDNSLKTSAIGISLGYLIGGGCRAMGVGNAFRVRGGNHWRGMSKGRYSRKPKPPRYPSN